MAEAETAYTPLAKRKENPLAPEHFPSFGANSTPTTPKVAGTPSFLDRIKAAEEERKRQQEDATYDPSKLGTLSRAQLEREGWAVLPLKLTKADFLRMNAPLEADD